MTTSIRVSVFPHSKKNTVTKIKDDVYEVHLKAKPEHNQANELLIKALAEYFSLPTAAIHIETGAHSHHKRINIVR